MEQGTIACSKKKLRTVICDREDVAWLVAETDRQTDGQTKTETTSVNRVRSSKRAWRAIALVVIIRFLIRKK